MGLGAGRVEAQCLRQVRARRGLPQHALIGRERSGAQLLLQPGHGMAQQAAARAMLVRCGATCGGRGEEGQMVLTVSLEDARLCHATTGHHRPMRLRRGPTTLTSEPQHTIASHLRY